jgi:hypothetical protein
MYTAVKIKQNSEARDDAPEPHTLHHAPEPHVLHHPAHCCHAERSSPTTVIDDSPLPRVSIIFLMKKFNFKIEIVGINLFGLAFSIDYY